MSRKPEIKQPVNTNATAARYADWRPRLLDYLHVHVHCPFVYGQFDCALFVFGAVAAMTGTDPGAMFRGQYTTLAEGIALLRKAGLRDHVALLATLFEEIAPAFAQVGDIAVLDGADGPALGLVQGAHIYALIPQDQPLVTVPLLAAHRAFRVA